MPILFLVHERHAYGLRLAFGAFLRRIPERDANIFIARYYYFEDVKRIADENGIRANNAAIILFRTRAKLTRFLKEEKI